MVCQPCCMVAASSLCDWHFVLCDMLLLCSVTCCVDLLLCCAIIETAWAAFSREDASHVFVLWFLSTANPPLGPLARHAPLDASRHIIEQSGLRVMLPGGIGYGGAAGTVGSSHITMIVKLNCTDKHKMAYALLLALWGWVVVALQPIVQTFYSSENRE